MLYSSIVHSDFIRFGFKWFAHRSLHFLPFFTHNSLWILELIYLEIAAQPFFLLLATIFFNKQSSSSDQVLLFFFLNDVLISLRGWKFVSTDRGQGLIFLSIRLVLFYFYFYLKLKLNFIYLRVKKLKLYLFYKLSAGLLRQLIKYIL